MNTTRSRCAGSMFAWILNTTPEKFFIGEHPSLALQGDARLARRRGELDQRVEDFADAEIVDGGAEENRRLPAGRGIRRRARTAWHRTRLHQVECRLACRAPVRRRSGFLDARDCRGPWIRLRPRCTERDRRRARNTRMRVFLAGRITPWKRLPMPIGQENGHRPPCPGCCSISSIRSSGSLDFAVHLVDEGDDGRAARPADFQQAAGSAASTPFAASITISAASTAVSTR